MKIINKRILSISMVLMLVLLGLAALATPTSAGFIGDVPVRPFKIDKISWDRQSQEFVIGMSLKFGLATAGEHAGFTVSSSLKIDTGEAVFVIDPQEDSVHKAAGAKKVGRNMVMIEPQRIPWDRDGGMFTGTIIVTITIVLINPGGGGMTEINPPTIRLNTGIPDTD